MTVIDNKLIADRTEAINKVPAKPGLISSLGFFKTRTVNQDNITFDVQEGSLKVLSDKLRSVADKNTVDAKQYDQHVLKIPHYNLESLISRDQLAGVRAFDSESEKQVAQAIAEHLEDHADLIDYHVEYVQAKMLFNAQLVTENYGTYDLAAELGVSQGTQTLSYTNPGETLKQFRDMQNGAKAGMNSGRVNGYILFASDDMFEWLIRNGDFVRAFELNMSGGPNPLLGELGNVAAGYNAFNFGSTTIVNYNDSFTLADGSKEDMLAEGSGLLVPRGVVGKTFYGPQNTLTGLSRGGARAFSRTVRDDRDRFISVESETNVLPILESVGATIKVDFV